MFLIKCQCGCIYKLDQQSLENTELNRNRRCPNCGLSHRLDDTPTLKALSCSGIEIIRVPDNCQIEIKLTL